MFGTVIGILFVFGTAFGTYLNQVPDVDQFNQLGVLAAKITVFIVDFSANGTFFFIFQWNNHHLKLRIAGSARHFTILDGIITGMINDFIRFADLLSPFTIGSVEFFRLCTGPILGTCRRT